MHHLNWIFCWNRELTSVGVKAVKPTAGYYIFPDFEVIKENLKRRGIKTCEEMCKAILDECGVAVSWDFSFFSNILLAPLNN